MNEENVFWDQVFVLALNSNSVALVVLTEEIGKKAAKIADAALKARRKTFAESAKSE